MERHGRNLQLHMVGHFLGWTGPIGMDRSIWPFRPILSSGASRFGIFHVQHRRKRLSWQFLWIEQ